MLLTTCVGLAIGVGIFITASVHGEPIKFTSCGPNDVIGVDLSPCPEQPCVFHHGENATMKIKFKSNMNSKNLTSHVYGIVSGVPIPFPLPNLYACENSGIECPITEDTQYLYQSLLPVKKDYPDIRLDVMWKLLGDEDKVTVCIVFPIVIKD